MTTTNAAAKDAMLAAGVRAATDVTGFGLLGHLSQDVAGLRLRRAGRRGCRPGDRRRPRARARAAWSRAARSATTRSVREATDWGELDEPDQFVLADAQTSGGMLIAAPDPRTLERGAPRALACPVRAIGTVVEGPPGRMTITGDPTRLDGPQE